jgi:membrane-associated phospholipid phosphatase
MRRFGALLLALTLGNTVAAPCDDGIQGTPAREDGRRTLRRLVPNLGRGAIGVFHRDSLEPLFVGTMATGFAAIYDDDVADWIADPDHDFGKSFEDGARPELVGAVVAGVFVGGRLAASPRFRAVSYDLLDAFVLNWGYTSVLKQAVGRERPNGQDDKSFPSGHTSNAFALATVAERHYGWKAGVPAYVVASLVAVSRLQRNKHHLSDVVAGAAVGYIVARTVVRVNDTPLDKSPVATLSLTPLLGRRARGLMVAVAF